MTSNLSKGGAEGSVTKWEFIEKAARSVTELQANVNNLADVLVFLEVLGYTDADAKKVGLTDVNDLSRKVFERVDYYDEGGLEPTKPTTEHFVPVPSARKRLVESLSLASPWLGALALLYAFGVSLWMVWGLPLGPVTALMVGVYLGLLVSEGPMQAFTRIFMFYHSQGNVSECARALKRSYFALSILLCSTLGVLAASAYLLRIPLELAALAGVGAATIAVHRIGYLPIYALKKTRTVVISYAVALPVLVATFVLTPGYFPDPVIRYLVALGSALGVLSMFAWYHTRSSLVIPTSQLAEKDAPPFFRPIFYNVHTIGSKFSIQFWETLPYYLSGTFFFMLLFSDRVLSWLGNPIKVVGGVQLPMVFNSVYHSGADMALVVLFPVALVQYIMLSSLHEELQNLTLNLPTTQTDVVDKFIRMRHAKVMVMTLAVSVATVFLLLTFGSYNVLRLGGTQTSLQVMYIAALSNLLLTIYVANSSFMILLNNAKVLAMITMVGAFIVGGLGAFLLPMGFEYLVYGYLAGCAFVALFSTVKVHGLLSSPSSLFFAKFN